jgi:hypothetical protein
MAPEGSSGKTSLKVRLDVKILRVPAGMNAGWYLAWMLRSSSQSVSWMIVSLGYCRNPRSSKTIPDYFSKRR